MTPQATTLAGRRHDWRTLFEPRIVAQMFGENLRLLGRKRLRPTAVRVERCWPFGNDALVFEWSFRMGDDRTRLFGRVDFSTREKATRARRIAATGWSTSLGAEEMRGVLFQVRELNLTVHTPDCDVGLPHLAACLDRNVMASSLSDIFSLSNRNGHGAIRRMECQLRGYRPGRRAAIRFRASKGNGAADSCLGKTFCDLRGKSLLARHALIQKELLAATDGRIGVAEPLAFVPEHMMAVFSWARGRQPSTNPVSMETLIVAAAVALSSLHKLDLSHFPSFTVNNELAIVQRWYDLLRMVDEERAVRVKPLVSSLAQVCPNENRGRVTSIHRDFYEKQLIVTDKRVFLLDLDTLAAGDPCVDLGNFLAHLLLDFLRHNRPLSAFRAQAVSFLRRYRRLGGEWASDSLRFFLSSSLFRLGAVHSLRTSTRRYSQDLWDIAAAPERIRLDRLASTRSSRVTT